MKERPIMFSGPLVRAILDDRKTQTRHVVKPQPAKWVDRYSPSIDRLHWIPSGVFISDPSGILGRGKVEARANEPPARHPYGIPGDRLWVRERSRWSGWASSGDWEAAAITYAAGGTEIIRVPQPGIGGPYKDFDFARGKGWLTPIHMPRWASRITLEITDVRVQRLQEISEADAKAEGIVSPLCTSEVTLATGHATYSYSAAFGRLWDYINGNKSPWASNPWVWAITFRRIED